MKPKTLNPLPPLPLGKRIRAQDALEVGEGYIDLLKQIGISVGNA